MSFKNCFLVNAWHRSVKWPCHYFCVVYLLAEFSIFFPSSAQAIVFGDAQVESQLANGGLQLGNTVLQILPTVAWPVDWFRVESGQNLVDGVMEKLPSISGSLETNSVVSAKQSTGDSNNPTHDGGNDLIHWRFFIFEFIGGMVGIAISFFVILPWTLFGREEAIWPIGSNHEPGFLQNIRKTNAQRLS